jgi:three-Cys-motif partner protein
MGDKGGAARKATAKRGVAKPVKPATPAKTTKNRDDRQQSLLSVGPAVVTERELKRLRNPVWTESKAKLIQTYLKLFTFITKHGTYIDAFAGAQEIDKPEMWSAKLVLECEPRWLRHFHLFECDEKKVRQLRGLTEGHNRMLTGLGRRPRDLHVYDGDCNVEIPMWLERYPIRDKEATFALLDQRTFECHWATLNALAKHKRGGHKIELFYFLPNKWLDRSLAALTKNPERAQLWWGRDDWQSLRDMTTHERAMRFAERFKQDFGYASVKPWPISERKAGGGSVMYFMIHATDHPDAPVLMSRAFQKAVDPTKPVEQGILPGT